MERERVSWTAQAAVVFVVLGLTLSALAFLCAAHHVTTLERTLAAPVEIP